MPSYAVRCCRGREGLARKQYPHMRGFRFDISSKSDRFGVRRDNRRDNPLIVHVRLERLLIRSPPRVCSVTINSFAVSGGCDKLTFERRRRRRSRVRFASVRSWASLFSLRAKMSIDE